MFAQHNKVLGSCFCLLYRRVHFSMTHKKQKPSKRSENTGENQTDCKKVKCKVMFSIYNVNPRSAPLTLITSVTFES